MHVLFVCTGNVCRSPTAERLAVAYAEELGITDLTAESAGTEAVVGAAMEPTAAQVLEGLGGDPGKFTARLLTADLAVDADLVLTMTESHRDKVLALAPEQLKKTFTLKEAARLAEASDAKTVADLASARPQHKSDGTPEDISDPIGKDEETFLNVGSEIAELLGVVARSIRV
ncbi:tyrosine phosphatase [Rhodococcus opacus PD630]|uniref:arsenate reductase/protein-tyrosine-phosphatase family protein n=1 Tax=Rhodococcus TaxID=1827 RepID=UPI00029CB685|nr:MULTISPECIES: protein-tyrosine-phosphatase [Rhodococcus]EHI45595.1 tyrosine phosphatase [Rhodococcus opacus PD630]KXX60049.1 protein tyrosine phosphatase [Rhodococcus sp. LB1]UDG99042.1 protein tyrosine phosphatase [Rhodococcus opacus PD630]